MHEQGLIMRPHEECLKKNIKQKWCLLTLAECGVQDQNC